MNLKQVQLLTLLKTHEFNLSACADKMNIVQSATSKMLQELERELDLEIVERNGKRIKGFTPEGEEIFTHASRIVQAIDSIHQIGEEFNTTEISSIRIGTTLMQARYFLPSVLREFVYFHPQVSISLIQAHPSVLLEQLQKNELDVVICSEVLGDYKDQFIQHQCYPWRHVILLAPNHPLADISSLTLKQLAQYPICTYPHKQSGRTEIDAAFEEANLNPTIALESTDPSVISAYVSLGLGVGIVAETAYAFEENTPLIAKYLKRDIALCETLIALQPSKAVRAHIKDFVHLTLTQGEDVCRVLKH